MGQCARGVSVATWLFVASAGALLEPVEVHALTRDVFEVAGSGPLCPNNTSFLVPTDLLPTVDGPTGPAETAVEFRTLTGWAAIEIFGSDFQLSSSYQGSSGCASSDQVRMVIRFVDMTAPGFNSGSPTTWTYRRIPWITVQASGDGIPPTPPSLIQVRAFRDINQGNQIAACGPSGGFCQFTDPLGSGIAELAWASNNAESALDELILRITEPASTPVGSNVTVSSGAMDATFPNVTAAGVTGSFEWPANPIATALPGGLFNCEPQRFYTLESTATRSGAPTICFQYPASCNESGIGLYHYHQTGMQCGPPPCGCLCPISSFGWENVTSSVDTTGNVICGGPTTPSGFSLNLDPLTRPYAVLSSSPPCAAEVCDGADNDCDGQIDEGFGLGNSCTAGVGACQRTGQIICNASGGTTCNATPGSPTSETCNGIDDDCDGTVDDGFNVGTACSVGIGQCLRNGARICDAGGTGTLCNATPGTPVAEACNGLDDDCDGTADEGNPGGGAACGTGLPGACGTGVLTCSAAALSCAQTVFPGTEVCNAVDDDCDGTSDEGAIDAPTWYADVDADTYGNPSVSQARCTQPGGYVGNAQDCDDSNPALGICNTPVGPDPVTFDDPSGAASVTLPDVTSPGDTTITSAPCGAQPVGIFTPPNPLCVAIDTTATFSGDAEVCINYDDSGLSAAQEQNLRMVRYPDAAACAAEQKPFPCPVALPLSGPLGPPPAVDIVNNVICATTARFSQFAVGVLTDVDGDFVQDVFDNCPLNLNFFQEDQDADGAGDVCDNCRVFANSSQVDVNANGIGNACECGDQDGNGSVNVSDLLAINLAIFNPGLVTALCDTNNDGLCNVSDIIGANLKIFGNPAYCSRYPPTTP